MPEARIVATPQLPRHPAELQHHAREDPSGPAESMEHNAGRHEYEREIRYADKEDPVKLRRPVPPCSLIFPYTRTATPVALCVSPHPALVCTSFFYR